MVSSQKILSAVRANWSLNAIGLVVSYGASILLVRAMRPELFAQYAATLGLVSLATLVFEAGANSGLTRYLADAAQQHARGTFYRQMQRRRWFAAIAGVVAFGILGPVYARSSRFEALAAQPWLFVVAGAVVAATLMRLLAHYGLIALFETKLALLMQQGFQILRSIALATIAIAGGTLAALLGALLAIALIEAAVVHVRLWRIIAAERAPLPAGFLNRAQAFGLLTILDKFCAMLGGGTVLMLVLAPAHAAATIALLALAVDLVGKLTALSAMPMGNLVSPYLSQTSDDATAQGVAIARIVKFSSLVYAASVAAGVLVLPWFVSAVYGKEYTGTAGLALLLLGPTAFENWVRGCCSPALLRNRRGRELMTLNAAQAIVSLLALAFAWRLPVATAVIVVGGARALVAAWNLVLIHPLVPAGTWRVPLQGAAVSLLSLAAAWAWGLALPLPAAAKTAAQAVVFALCFYAGLRWLIFRDAEMLRLAHRLTGTRLPLITRLLPAPALQNA